MIKQHPPQHAIGGAVFKLQNDIFMEDVTQREMSQHKPNHLYQHFNQQAATLLFSCFDQVRCTLSPLMTLMATNIRVRSVEGA